MKFSRRAAPSFPFMLGLCCAFILFTALVLAGMGGRNYLGSLDFRVYLTAGKMALNHTGALFYDLPSQFAVQRGLWPQMESQNQLLPFLAPPFVAILFAPLALFSPVQGYALWTMFNAILLFFIAREVVQMPQLEGRQNLFALAMLFTFPPVLFAVMQGQVSLLVVWAFMQSWKAAKTGRDWQAGLWFSMMLIRPQLALLPLLIFALKGRWKLLGGFASGAALLGAISLGLVGVEGLKRYLELLGAVSNWQGIYGVVPGQMQTWRGLLHAVFATESAAAVRLPWLLGVGAALISVIFGWRGAWKVETPRFDHQWAILGIGALFCCPYLYSHDLSLLAVCGALIFGAARRENSRLVWLPLGGYGVMLVWAVSLAIWPRPWPVVALLEAVALALLVWNPPKSSLAAESQSA